MPEPPSSPTSSDERGSEPVAVSADRTRQLGLVAAIASLGTVFWVVGAMEMIERLAFYGVKAGCMLYATASRTAGGLGVSASVFGDVLMLWALVQSILPVFVGGLADRFGYKRTIFLSTLVKIGGYLVMALLPSYPGFFAGAVLLATGTAIFKPGIQGTLVHATRPDNSSMAWGIFYQLVNVGGWVGPLLGGFLRSRLSWAHVFFACAVVISANLVLVFTYREPTARGPQQDRSPSEGTLLRETLGELRRRHVWTYLLIFSGFWFMFNSLFDVLPLYVRDWVDTRPVVHALFGAGGIRSETVRFLMGADPTGHSIQPEGMLNLNAGLIMTTCFVVSWLGGKLRATTSMVIGTLMASVAMALSGRSQLAFVCVLSIGIFSVGEMLSSPKFSEYIGRMAPPRKTAMYLGFSQIPLAIGWTLEGKLGPVLYDRLSSKEQLSRAMLRSHGLGPAEVARIPEGEAFARLTGLLRQSADATTELLRSTHDVGRIWWIMTAVGLLSALGIVWYARSIRRVAPGG
jgi:proton-dependent oligopeptide transporter, POT family